MGLKAMLTVDLNRVTDEQRKLFNQELESKRWFKIKSLTTIWRASFRDDVTEAEAIRITQGDVESSAATAGISNYDAGVMVGPNFPTTWSKRP